MAKPSQKKTAKGKPKGKKPVAKAKAPAAPKTIGFADLSTLVATDKITEADIGRYFYSKGTAPGAMVPTLAVNRLTVDTAGSESLVVQMENDLAYRAIESVRRSEAVKAGAPAPNGTIVAEGDSWFNLPEFGFPIFVPPTLVDVLALTFPINNIAHWGDTLAQIVNAGEYISYLKTGKVKYFLFSAGGNDVLGNGRLAEFVSQRASGDNDPANAHRYITPAFEEQLREVMALYAILAENVRQLSPKTIMLVHGYDFARPVPRGPWMGTAMESRGFHPSDNRAICRAVIAEMLSRFNTRLENFAKTSGGKVRYVSLLNVVGDAWWDELHPNKGIVGALAARFEAELTP